MLLADFYRAGDGVDEGITAQMIVSADIAPDIAGTQSAWIQGVGWCLGDRELQLGRRPEGVTELIERSERLTSRRSFLPEGPVRERERSALDQIKPPGEQVRQRAEDILSPVAVGARAPQAHRRTARPRTT